MAWSPLLLHTSFIRAFGSRFPMRIEISNGYTDKMPTATGTAKTCLFKLGDRVKFNCSSSYGLYQTSSRGPTNGSRGKVVLILDDNPLSKIGMRFDKSIPDGVNLGGACDESRSAPFILFMEDAEKSIVGNGDPYSFKSKLENLPNNVVVIGSHTETDSRKEKSHPGGLPFTKFGSKQTALLDLAFLESFGRLHDRGKEVLKPNKTLTKNSEADPDSKLILSCESVQYGIGILQSIQNEYKSQKKSLKDVVIENEFEKRLLADVIPPSVIDVTFDDIGALENVKDTLKELVMLPL
ncbi:hypothetical protein VNO77_07933 [Canavalia gladiata]|uniref:Uncharacterized protein n=1 Tax=Canavalia gladiata TaxID=3824 RepID=A0AAN9MBV3_CANGL